jgi:sortase A
MLETACWTGGILLVGLYFGARAYGEIERRQAVSGFTEARAYAQAEHGGSSGAGPVALEPTAGEPFWTNGVPDQTLWSASRIRAHAAVAVEGATLPAALLRIRRVGLEVPVYADTSERNLNRGAGLIEGTAVPDSDGNIAIAAHRDGYFRVLERVVVGDVLELDSLSRRRSYRVTEIAIVEPTDMSPLDETDAPALTLVTCYPFYFAGPAPQRHIVRALAID